MVGEHIMGMSPLIREYDKLTEKAEDTPKAGRRNKWVALALCILFGMVGGHKLYEKKFGIALVYILLTILDNTVMMIVLFMDAFIILMKDTHYYIEKYEFQDVKNSYTPRD